MSAYLRLVRRAILCARIVLLNFFETGTISQIPHDSCLWGIEARSTNFVITKLFYKVEINFSVSLLLAIEIALCGFLNNEQPSTRRNSLSLIVPDYRRYIWTEAVTRYDIKLDKFAFHTFLGYAAGFVCLSLLFYNNTCRVYTAPLLEKQNWIDKSVYNHKLTAVCVSILIQRCK